MNKTFLVFLSCSLLCIVSCKKSNDTAPSVPAQTWTFKSITYHTVECFADTITNNLGLHANDGAPSDSTNYCAILCNFYGQALPATNGTYTVALVNAPDSSLTQQVVVSLMLGGLTNVYQSTGGNGKEVVYVTVNNGKISVTGTGIELENYNSATTIDSAALSFNITQTQ